MRDRIRNRTQPASGTTARRVTRMEREARQQRLLYIITGIAAAVVVTALLAGAAYQYYFYPRGALASVNGDEIQRRDYWKVRGLQLRQNIAQLSQQFQFTQPDQQPQIQQQIQQAQAELTDVRDAPVSQDTLSNMVDNLVILQSADEFGIEITDEEIDQYVNAQFAPVPLTDPTPTPPTDPTAAAWATGTAEANAAQATATAEASATAAAALASPTSDAGADGTPEETGTATDDEDATPTEGDEDSSTPEATIETSGSPTAAASPDADGTPGEGTPEVTEASTPSREEALSTAETTFDLYDINYLEPSDMSISDYERLIVRPELVRERIRESLVSDVPSRAEQIRASHILVATQEAAQDVINRLNNGEDFADLAREVSTDTGSGANGGDLGWFPRGVMVDPFEEAAFGLEPGAVSEPVQTQFGWHIIRVEEKEADRPISLTTLQSLRGQVFDEWLSEQRAEADIEADIALTNLEDPSTDPDLSQPFEAPPDAPLPPTPAIPPTTPVDAGTPEVDGTETSPDEDDASPTP